MKSFTVTDVTCVSVGLDVQEKSVEVGGHHL